MKISGPCEECNEKPAVVGLGPKQLCMKCFEAALAAILEPQVLTAPDGIKES